MTPRLLSVLALASFACGALHAQSAADRAASASDADFRRRLEAERGASAVEAVGSTARVPSLYEGELEDVGPQMLLMERPPHDWFFAAADLQNYYTSNAALDETATWSDVSVFTAEAGVNAGPFSFADGKLAVSGGYRYQTFKYGWLSGRTNHDIANSAGVKLDRLDFDTHTGHLEAEWTHGGWFAGVSARYSAYFAFADYSSTYSEWVPALHGGYRFTLSERDFISADFDADYRFTSTPRSVAGLSVEGDRYDRYDLGATFAYTHVFGTSFLLRPAYRFQYSDFTEGGSIIRPSNGRDDFLHTLSLTAAYFFNRNLSARVFGSCEFRESDEASDYANYNAGAGALVSLTF